MTATLTWSGVTAQQMARHTLAEPAADLDPAAVAGLLCGAHAQVLAAAHLHRAADHRGDPRRCAARALAGTLPGQGAPTAAPSACCRPPTCRCGPGRCGPLRRRYRSTRRASALRPPGRNKVIVAIYPGAAAARARCTPSDHQETPVLLNGEVAGVWHQRRSGRKLAITVEPLGDLSRAAAPRNSTAAALVGRRSWRPRRR